MDRHRRLPVLEGGELLGSGGRDRAVARDDAFDQTAHGLEPERERNDVEQKHVGGGSISRQRFGLDRRADRDHLVRVEVDQRRSAKQLADRALHQRHPRRAAHQDDAVDPVRLQLGVAQGLTRRGERSLDERSRHGFELGAVDRHAERLAAQRAGELDPGQARQGFLRNAGGDDRGPAIAPVVGDGATLFQSPGRQGGIDVVAAEGRIAPRGHDLEHALRHAQQRDVEGAAAEVVDRIEAFGRVVQAVSDGCGGWLADEPEHMQAGQFGRALGGLALRIVEVRRHGDDGTEQLDVESVFGALAERGWPAAASGVQ